MLYNLYQVLGRYYAQQLFLKSALQRAEWLGVEQVVSFGEDGMGCVGAEMLKVEQERWEKDLEAQGFEKRKKTLFNLFGARADGAFLLGICRQMSVGSEMIFDTMLAEWELEELFHDTGVLVYEYVDSAAMTRQYLHWKLQAPEGIGYCLAVRHR